MVNAVTTKERPRVLVVAEQAVLRDALAGMLDGHAAVASAVSARKALELAEHEAFDVVCADAEMVIMSATDMFRRMTAVLGHVGYLLVTTPGSYARAPADSRWHVIFKPVDAAKLTAAVLQLSRLAQMRRSVADLGRMRGKG
jgi:DNA-binding NtrC family response regulator